MSNDAGSMIDRLVERRERLERKIAFKRKLNVAVFALVTVATGCMYLLWPETVLLLQFLVYLCTTLAVFWAARRR